ncbi:MAG: DUF1837 domain-containing protein [Candidatus Azobacteroides sp.]|nr:DUF1837 domain-containing protein [Candidatus Azobacteroides sp.]
MPTPHPPRHISFLHNTGTILQTSDGKDVEVWELRHNSNNIILSQWAKYFREHYCKDSDIDSLRSGTGFSRRDYLNNLKFPSASHGTGPGARAGDFGEILVADFLEFIDNYEVLSRKTRYNNRINRDTPDAGSDVIGFRFINYPNPNPIDELAIFETKAKFTGRINDTKTKQRLQDAIDGSVIDIDRFRIAASLNAMKQRFIDKNMDNEKSKVERFQNETDHPYKMVNGAVALVCNSNYSTIIATSANSNNHPNKVNLRLIIIKGDNMMNLVRELYRRAANEA